VAWLGCGIRPFSYVMQSDTSNFPVVSEPLNVAERRLMGSLAEVWRVQQRMHGSAEAAAQSVDLHKLDAKLSELHAAGKAAAVHSGKEVVAAIDNAGLGTSSFPTFLGEGKSLHRHLTCTGSNELAETAGEFRSCCVCMPKYHTQLLWTYILQLHVYASL